MKFSCESNPVTKTVDSLQKDTFKITDLAEMFVQTLSNPLHTGGCIRPINDKVLMHLFCVFLSESKSICDDIKSPANEP